MVTKGLGADQVYGDHLETISELQEQADKFQSIEVAQRIIDEYLIKEGVGHALKLKQMDKMKNPYEATKSVMLGTNILQIKKTTQDVKKDDKFLNDLVEPIAPGSDMTGSGRCTLKFRPAPPK